MTITKLEKVKRKAKSLGLKGEITISKNKSKKFDYIADNKKVSFGYRGSEDYLDHTDEQRRNAYRKRHSAIKLKDGSQAIKKRGSAAFLSYNLLW